MFYLNGIFCVTGFNLELLADWFTAIGTVGAVLVALIPEFKKLKSSNLTFFISLRSDEVKITDANSNIGSFVVKNSKLSDMYMSSTNVIKRPFDDNSNIKKFNIDINVINPNERLEVFKIINFETNYIDSYKRGNYKEDKIIKKKGSGISGIDEEIYMCAGENQLYGKLLDISLSIKDENNKGLFWIKMEVKTEREGDTYSIASFFWINKSGATSIITLRNKNIGEIKFNSNIQNELKKIDDEF